MKIPQEVVLELEAMALEGNLARIARQLDRPLYQKVDRVLKACGGKWDRAKQAHVFGREARPILEAAMSAGSVATDRDVGFFPTPQRLAQELAKGVRPGDNVLEPSAGDGALAKELVKAGAAVFAAEIDEGRRKILKGIKGVFLLPERDCMDIKRRPGGAFDGVVMNPPFCRSGKGDHLDHVVNMANLVRPGGCVTAVLPWSVMFRQDRRHREFRAWAEGTMGGRFERLPSGTFKEAGTSVETCVLRMR